ncbi:MAG: acyltransferase [Pseudomonadota bacterium]
MSKDGHPPQERAHDRALDGLRGIAILLVLVMHTLHFEGGRPLWGWINSAIKAGWIGVDLFFVLSGFLITRILVQMRDAPNRTSVFYGRRALRILPGYFFYLLLAVPPLLLFAAPAYVSLTREMLPWLMVFGQNFHAALSAPGLNLGPLSHLWSLAVEEQFYLLWPFLVWHVKTEHLARAALLVGLLAVLCKLLLAAAEVAPHVPYVLPFTRMDGFAAGAWLAARQATGLSVMPGWLRPLPAAAALLLGVTLLMGGSGWPLSIWPLILCLSLTPLIFAGLLHKTLVAAPGSALRSLLGQPWLLFFGRHSYALYLVHPGVSVLLLKLVLPLLRDPLPGNAGRLTISLLTWLASIALALLVDRWIDGPARRVKQRLQPDTAPAALKSQAAYS